MISKSAATFCCAPAPGAIIAEHNTPNEKKYHPTIKASNCSYLPFFYDLKTGSANARVQHFLYDLVPRRTVCMNLLVYFSSIGMVV
jgi:hypothetical protein